MGRVRCDVLVVGLGPAGSSAARAAASRGLSVIAVDKRARIGEPVQCAEFIPQAIARYASGSGVLRQAIAGMRTILPSGEMHHSPFAGLTIDRGQFDRDLAQKALEAGADLRLSTALTALDLATRIATVRRGGESEDIGFRVLAAADGPLSKVGALAGLPALRVVRALQYSVALAAPLSDTLVWLSDATPGGYAWLFPRGNEANLGLGMDGADPRERKQALEHLHRGLIAEGLVERQILRRTGGDIPVGGLRSPLAHGAILFAGDAAGMTHPVTGAGIAAAVCSGEAAGLAAADTLSGHGDALEDYQQEMRELYGPTFQRALRARAQSACRADDSAGRRYRRGWVAFEDYFAA
jgi:digeranylgeranylglycerophospholipid reductase